MSRLFSEITEGRYPAITYDSRSQEINILRKDENILTLEKLSKGTRDQLYLAIRVHLGQQLLKDETGFFVLDDAFLSSDKDRLAEQIKVLQNLAKQGWQIVYFTTREELANTLGTISGNPPITLERLALDESMMEQT